MPSIRRVLLYIISYFVWRADELMSQRANEPTTTNYLIGKMIWESARNGHRWKTSNIIENIDNETSIVSLVFIQCPHYILALYTSCGFSQFVESYTQTRFVLISHNFFFFVCIFQMPIVYTRTWAILIPSFRNWAMKKAKHEFNANDFNNCLFVTLISTLIFEIP